MAGSVQAFQSLKSKAPPVTILIKAMQYDSIMWVCWVTQFLGISYLIY